MKILVTGSTGFVGSKICQALCREGYAVRAFHRSSSSLAGLEGLPVEHVIGDLTQPHTLTQALAGVQVVFHAAALLGGRPAALEKHIHVTVEGTRNILEVALHAGVERFIHTSSVAALGVPELKPVNDKRGAHQLLDESHTWNFPAEKWHYGYAKYCAEMEVQQAVAKGLDAVVVNPSVVLGPGDVYRLDNSIVVQMAKRKIPALIGGGMNVVHIDDVVRGHLAAWRKGKRGERYILGGENISMQGFLWMTAGVCGVKPPRLVIPDGLLRVLTMFLRLMKNPPVAPDLFNLGGYYFYYNIEKAGTELGLSNVKTARQAVEDAYTWFRQVGVIS